MKSTGVLLGIAVVLIIGFALGWTSHRSGGRPALLYEGIIWTVEWTDGEGISRGMTRSSIPEAVPGRSGSWNMDMYGRLYASHLEIELRKSENASPKIIPLNRIVEITFGNGGIREVGGN
ncbi:MAG: hypothetical protein ABIH23_34355 [bacterium]